MSERLLIRGGLLLQPDGIEPVATLGDVLVESGVIVAVGANLTAGDSVSVIDATGTLVTPGFVDTHVHLWQTALRGMTADLWAREYFHTVHPMSEYTTPEDMYWASYAGALELMSHGVTRAFDYCHSANSPEHVDASIRGLRDSGIRATFGFGLFEREGSSYRDRTHRLDDLTRIAEAVAGDELVDVALALDHEFDAEAVALARTLGMGISVHGNPPGLLQAFADADALGPDVLWVHGNFASERELAALAASGASLALTPDIEMGMGKPVAIFDRAVRAGIPITLGVDVVSYAAADPFTQMRLAYSLHRLLDGEKERSRGHIPPHRDLDVPLVSTRDIVRSATTNGTRALNRGIGASGSIAIGETADLVLVSTEPFGLSMGDPAGHLVLQATSRDVQSVIVGGVVRLQAGSLVDVDEHALSARLRESRARLLSARDSSRSGNALLTH